MNGISCESDQLRLDERVDCHSTSSTTSGPTLPARVMLAIFGAYQLVRIGRVSPCRFTPTCSQYAIEAVNKHGGRRGLALTIRRLMRCRPGGSFGFDPVPE
jgi:uncharacterized protein